MPMVKGILILGEDGSRVSAKYFDKTTYPDHAAQTDFEQKLSRKIKGTTAKNEADVIILDNTIIVFRAGIDLNFCIFGSAQENELILANVLDGFYDALNQLLRGQLDRRTVLDNMALVLLAQDELVDAGLILETDARDIAARVLMRGAEGQGPPGGAGGGAATAAGGGGPTSFAELTLSSALQTAKSELIKRMAT